MNPIERGEADDVESVVALEPDLGAGERRHQEHDADRAAADHQRTAAQAHLGELSPDLRRVVAQRDGDLDDGHEVEPQDLVADASRRAERPSVRRGRLAWTLMRRRRNELGVHLGDHEVGREQRDEVDDDRRGDGVAHPRRPVLGVHAPCTPR